MSILYRHFWRLGTVFLLCFFAQIAVPAAANTLYTVKDVRVDERAENALAARENAFMQAQRRAFNTLAQRLLSEEALYELSIVPPELISPLIKDYEVTDEKLSSVRYIGTYTFRFREDAVKRFFARNDLSYSDLSAKPMLVLPYFHGLQNAGLWGHDNLWLQAWTRSGQQNTGLVPFVVPVGDLEDVRSFGDEYGVTYDKRELGTLLRRYNAGEAVLAVAIPDQNLLQVSDPAAPARGGMRVNLYRTDKAQAVQVGELHVQSQYGQNRMQFYDMAVDRIQRELQSDWKNNNLTQNTQKNAMKVHVAYKNLGEWVEIQSLLKRVYGLDQVEIEEMAPSFAAVILHYQGDEADIRRALERESFYLSSPQIETSIWGFDIQKDRVYDLYYGAPRADAAPTYQGGENALSQPTAPTAAQPEAWNPYSYIPPQNEPQEGENAAGEGDAPSAQKDEDEGGIEGYIGDLFGGW